MSMITVYSLVKTNVTLPLPPPQIASHSISSPSLRRFLKHINPSLSLFLSYDLKKRKKKEEKRNKRFRGKKEKEKRDETPQHTVGSIILSLCLCPSI